MNAKVYNQTGQEVGTLELSDAIFGIEPNEAVVHQYIVNYLARQRQGNAKTKERGEVRGGGRKPWRQKGTGRARAGTSRSPLWRGGGTVFGPRPRLYGSKFPKKMKQLAIRSILSDRAQAERIVVLDQLQFEAPKTKEMVSVLDSLKLADRKCLVLDEGHNDNLILSVRNLPRVDYCRAAVANGYQLLDAEVLVFTKAGIEKVQEVFA
jgi:large subunit ribosomal protein L4